MARPKKRDHSLPAYLGLKHCQQMRNMFLKYFILKIHFIGLGDLGEEIKTEKMILKNRKKYVGLKMYANERKF